MSSEEKSNDKKQRRNGRNSDSFDSFGDDLAELIVNYLPITDLIGYESVSKQFQWSGIRSLGHIKLTNRLLDQLAKQQQPTNHCQCCQSLSEIFRKHLMKKLPQICSIDVRNLKYRSDKLLSAAIMSAILDNWQQLWPKLGRIDGYCVHSMADQQSVGLTAAAADTVLPVQHLIRSLDMSLSYSTEPKPWLKQFRRLRQLSVDRIADVFDVDNQLMVTGLHAFRCQRLDVDRFQTFIDGNSRHLKQLSIDCLSNIVDNDDDDDMEEVEEDFVNQSLTEISRLTCLRQLAIQKLKLNQSIGDPLELIARNCRQLRRLCLRISYPKTGDNIESFVQTFAGIKQMNQLRRLEMQTIGDNQNQMMDIVLAEHQLTDDMKSRLQLIGNCWPLMTDLRFVGKLFGLIANRQFFVDIHQTIPRIQSLSVNSCLFSQVIDGQSVWSGLVQLPALKRLVIYGPVLDDNGNLIGRQVKAAIDKHGSNLQYVWIATRHTYWTQIKSIVQKLLFRMPYHSVRVIQFGSID